MNSEQRLWWRQSQSDHELFVELHGDRISAHECHLLHYLQMATEKLSKAYLWRSGHAPPKSHTGFVRFLRALVTRPDAELTDIALALGFNNHPDLITWVRNVLPLAYELQNFLYGTDCVIQVRVASFWYLSRVPSIDSIFLHET